MKKILDEEEVSFGQRREAASSAEEISTNVALLQNANNKKLICAVGCTKVSTTIKMSTSGRRIACIKTKCKTYFQSAISFLVVQTKFI